MEDLRDSGRTLPLAASKGRLDVACCDSSDWPKDGTRVLTASEAGRAARDDGGRQRLRAVRRPSVSEPLLGEKGRFTPGFDNETIAA
jgi:hypothetical protein